MSYLLDKKIKQKKILKILLSIAVLVFLFYFRTGIWNGLSFVGQGIFRPILVLGNKTGEKFKNLGSYFSLKNSLYLENENLQSQIQESQNDRANYNSVVAENVLLKEILERKQEKAAMVLVAILSKPNQNAYDTLLVDAGTEEGIKTGNMVFALGNVPIGRVALVYEHTSKVVLFSSTQERTSAIISPKNIFVEIVGRGGGNFEMAMPKDLVLLKGDQVVLPGIHPYVLAVVETVISDPRDLFTKALLVSPVNIQELKFVEIEI